MPPDTDPSLRIRLEHTRYPHWGGRTGYAQLARHLDPARFTAVLHGASDSDADFPQWLAPLRPMLRKIVSRHMPWYKLSDLMAEWQAFQICRRGLADIVHFLDGEHSGQFLPLLLRRAGLATVRTVATFHQPGELLSDLVDPAILRRFDQIVLMSPSQLPWFREHVAEDRLHVILHGVDTDFFRPALSGRTGPLRCVTAGHWLRDWDSFRAVAHAMPEIRFDIVTGKDVGTDGMANVRRHAGIDDQALATLYRAADILFLPLLNATANNALLEGIASGLPVVATNLEAVRAYLPGDVAILVEPGGINGFIEALRELHINPALRAKMAHLARQRAEALAWPSLITEYEKLYKNALRQQAIYETRSL